MVSFCIHIRRSNDYLIANIGFDTTDNDLVKFARSPYIDPPGNGRNGMQCVGILLRA